MIGQTHVGHRGAGLSSGRRPRGPLFGLRLLSLLFLTVAVHPAAAEVSSIKISSRTPFASGMTFGADIGGYERIDGIATGTLDPGAKALRGLSDLSLAEHGPDGLVHYSVGFTILKPVNAGQQPRRLLYEPVNRGAKLLLPWFNASPETGLASVNDPRSIKDAGNGFLFRHGYTVIWSGWEEGQVPARDGSLYASLPHARSKTASISRMMRFAWVPGGRGVPEAGPITLPYAVDAGRLNESRLAMRCSPNAAFQPVGQSFWKIDAKSRTVTITKDNKPGCQYSLHYVAMDSTVNGLGFVVVRDLMSFFKYDRRENPVRASLYASGGSQVIALGISQTGRFLRHFLSLGMNRDAGDRKVFDGMFIHIGGAGRTFANGAFTLPGTTVSSYFDAGYPESWYPFSYAATPDRQGGQPRALIGDESFAPKIIETNTGSEYWQKGAALLHTTTDGKSDLVLPDWVRLYFFAGVEHAGRPGLRSVKGLCQNPSSPLDPSPVMRALLVRLSDWIDGAALPPPSKIPRIADGSLVPQEKLNWAAHAPAPMADVIPLGVDANADPAPNNKQRSYPVLLPQLGPDGNEVAGIKLPEVGLSLGRFTGWNRFAPPFPTDGLCDRTGSAEEPVSPPQDIDAVKIDNYLKSLVLQGFLLDDDVPQLAARLGKLYTLSQ